MVYIEIMTRNKTTVCNVVSLVLPYIFSRGKSQKIPFVFVSFLRWPESSLNWGCYFLDRQIWLVWSRLLNCLCSLPRLEGALAVISRSQDSSFQLHTQIQLLSFWRGSRTCSGMCSSLHTYPGNAVGGMGLQHLPLPKCSWFEVPSPVFCCCLRPGRGRMESRLPYYKDWIAKSVSISLSRARGVPYIPFGASPKTKC